MGSRASLFRYAELRSFLEFARALRPVRSIRDWDGGAALVLRHDLDLDLQAVPAVSDIETEVGIAATYCVMTTSDLYNPAAPESRALLRRLAATGADIGLHHWPAAYPDADDAALAQHVHDEARLLEDIVGSPVVSLSLHNPTAAGAYPLFEGYRSAYGPALFAPGRYLSDSRMVLAEDPRTFVERTRGGVAQLLLHPEHFSDAGGGYHEIYREIERRRAATIDRYMSVNRTYAEDLPDGLFASLERPLRRVT